MLMLNSASLLCLLDKTQHMMCLQPQCSGFQAHYVLNIHKHIIHHIATYGGYKCISEECQIA